MRTFWVFLGGVLVGAAVGLVFAPAAGRRTRSLIRDKAIHYAHEASGFAERKSRHLRNVARGYAHRALERAGFTGDSGRREQPEA